MWSTAIRQLNFNASVMVAIESGSPPLPLKGVLVDVYRFSFDGGGKAQFERLNQAAARTSITGDFAFIDLPVPVDVQMVVPGSPPYTPVEVTNPNSLPNLAFRISVEAEVLKIGLSEGTQFVDVYDEREVIDQDWVLSHPERVHVALSGSPSIPVLIPEGNEEAILVAGITFLPPAVPGKEFHFLRVGRAIRDEIGELGESRPNYIDYVGKPGYMISSNKRTVNVQPSFFGGQIDAPFGRTLQIGGQFGATLLTPPLSDSLYYTVSFSEYTGSPTNVFDSTLLTNTIQLLSPLFNKRYILPTIALPTGKWETLNLGPFNGTITAVEPPHAPSLVGTSVMVYERPGLPDLTTEYWPFWDLIAIWNSTAAVNELIILTLEVYERTGGTDANPELKKLAMDSSINDHLPLHIDNRQPVPKLFDWRTGFATFGTESVVALAPFDPCSEMPVTPGQVNSNECILVKYSVEDGTGNAHPHVDHYGLWVEFTPRQVVNAPLSATVTLKGQGNNPANPPFGLGLGYKDINGHYTLSTPPIYTVQNFESVLVPHIDDGWPPEPMGDTPSPCVQYAAEVSLGCSVRTVNGWGRLFGNHHISRHIIIKR
ncbi:MAG: hypothetical protein GY845_26675 [Planctomycetes bacterium]|nr:hypothetical protein [Planctomycetota bacterium]